MKLYDNNPQSKAMQSLIHDSRNCGDLIRHHVKKLQDRLKELGMTDTRAYVHMEYIRSKTVDIEKAIDSYYERFSKDFPEDGGEPYKPEVFSAYDATLKYFGVDKWEDGMLPTYHVIKKLMENYTFIRNPDATQADRSDEAGNK